MKLFDVQRTQQLEYHYSHLIDKPFEAIFKFVHVLPGAFSGYRLKALQQKKRIDNNENNQESELKINKDDEDFEDSEILQEYFKSLNPSEKEIKATDYSTGKAILRVILPDFLFFYCYPKSDEVTEEQ